MGSPDGNLPAALERLSRAISALIDPRAEVMDGRTLWTVSLYAQLHESLPGQRGSGGRGSPNLPGCWLDALDLIVDIDDRVAGWVPVRMACHPGCISTPGRLAALEARSWRPQDTRELDGYSGALEGYAVEIVALLSAERHWSLPEPCPRCGVSRVLRRDSAGDLVRRAALQISPTGCTCGHCGSRWAPDQFAFLAGLLGYEQPEGVSS